ncbi:putative MFS family arabinose efflux permease [Kribbella solani]|uniref:Putative MFS family arabinose efflux permease n=1 Tax=Kribbella solani TaxID=236067 RepID=A0A841DP56_9ACTN|nr:putative MFS family arabinose efflux permease [Kribbella solani]
MSGTPRAGSYRDVLLLPSAPRTFVPALFGRLAYGLLPLSLLITVRQSTDSFATAGAAVAVFGLMSLSMPYKARLVDRYSQRRVLPVLAAGASAGLVGITTFGTTRTPVLLLVGITGLLAPPLGPSMRANWRRLTEHSVLKERAYALDAVAEECLFLGGPLIAGTLISWVSAAAALNCSAALLFIGTVAMVTSPVTTRTAAPAPSRHPLGPLVLPGLRRILLVIMATASGVSAAYLCVAGVAQHAGRPGAAGYVEAAIAAGSVVGGVLWARRTHTRTWSTHLGGLIAVLAAGLIAASFVTDLVVLGVVLGIAGVAVAPCFVVAYLAADEVTPPHQRTEASTWINTANNLGAATGAALAGLVLDRAAPSWGFLGGGVLLLVVATLCWSGAGARRSDVGPGGAEGAPGQSGVGETGDGGGGAADDRDRAGGEYVADEGVVPEDVGVDAAGAVPAVVADPVDDVAPAGRRERTTEVLHRQPGAQVAEGKAMGERPAAQRAEYE